MQNTDAQQLLSEILAYAEEGKLLEFRFIRNWDELIFYWRKTVSTKLIVRTLKSVAKKLFKTYCKDVIRGDADMTKLLAYSQLQDIIAFYERDLSTLKRMLDDYDRYLGQGNFWFSFLGGEREV